MIHYLLDFMLLMAAMPAFAQVSNDNEDEVYKIASHQAKDFVPGEVLLKLKDGQQAQVRRAAGRVQSAGINNLDKVLTEYGVQEMEQLLPMAKVTAKPRRAKAYNGESIVERDLTQLYKVTLSDEKKHETMQMVKQLKELDEVEFAEPNYKVYLMVDEHIADSYSDNSLATQQWYLDSYGVKALWNKPIINPTRPVIAIIDTGVDMTHPDLVDNLWTNQAEADGESGYDNDGNGFASDVHGWDFVNNTPNIRDNNMHGTHVAGIAAAANNGIGIVGANPLALIMPITVMQSDGTGDVATIVKGIDYAVANGATVLNLSLGTYANSLALRQALERAYQNAVIVAAAGNDGKPIDVTCGKAGAPMFPAAYSFVLGVMAATQNGGSAGFSNFDCDGPNYSASSTVANPDGFNYELLVPGTNMLSTIPGGNYKALQGTSMAAPLVAGSISALKMVKQYDTQEILWGDLTHTMDIAQAYNLTLRPAEIELSRIQLRSRKELDKETVEDYNSNNEINAGETVDIYPVFRTTFGPANNIKMHLEIGDNEDPSVVQILSGIVDFGPNLSSYGKAVSQNPLQLKVPDDIADGRHIRVKLLATCDNTETVFEKELVLIASNIIKINGVVNEDRTLTADHVYYVNENLGIQEGSKLTIEPGTRIEFAEGTELTSFGKLVANGTPEKPIIFTGHDGANWNGLNSHRSSGEHHFYSPSGIYTNSEMNLFTMSPTEQTPLWKSFYEPPFALETYFIGEYPGKEYYLEDYLDDEVMIRSNDPYQKIVVDDELFTDPNFLTPAILQVLSEMNEYYETIRDDEYSPEKNIASIQLFGFEYYSYDYPRDTISYCKIDGFKAPGYYPFMKDCDISPTGKENDPFFGFHGVRCNFSMETPDFRYVPEFSDIYFKHCNIINNNYGRCVEASYRVMQYSWLNSCNYFNNTSVYEEHNSKYYGKQYYLGIISSGIKTDKAKHPSYLGTAREDLVRPFIYETGNALSTWGYLDLSNMPSRPYAEAHGIVWKVCVNGKDAQDEYEYLAPLGVGKHKFEVYFNRPMNKAKTPQISFGVRDPYTQNVVDEDGSWNEEGNIYTAYKTITGKTKSDGVNRIYIYGAEDNEFFEIPYEKTRFNIQINAAGSMATGFAAEAGMGRINLTWNNENNNFDDAMGFNVYRIHEYEKLLPILDEWGGIVYETDEYGNTLYDEDDNPIVKKEMQTITDTCRLNKEVLDIETMSYTDYDVTPGNTYYYYYKVLSTDLKEYDVSNVVVAIPLTSALGDANGSGEVDVADVITTVNYAAGMEPKPFIFEAADMNADLCIDILDVIGIIQAIMNPGVQAAPAIASTAMYTIEDGVLYVESPVSLAGVQVQVNVSAEQEITVAQDLDGFEQTKAWLTGNDMLFLAYNMNGKTLSAGKHALLKIGDGEITQMRLSDGQGRNVMAIAGEGTTGIDAMGSKVLQQGGVFNLKGQKVAGNATDLNKLPKGVYIINGEKVVK